MSLVTHPARGPGMILVVDIFGAAMGLTAGAVLCYLLLAWGNRRARATEAREAHSVLERARQEAEAITHGAHLAASEEAAKLRDQAEQSLAARRAENVSQDRRLSEREALLNSQLTRIIELEKDLKQQKEAMDRKTTALENVQQELIELTRRRREELQSLAGLSPAEAREKFLKEIEQEALKDAGHLSRQILEDAKARAEEKARKVIAVAIQRYAGDQTFENTTATIALEGDDIKGRIIGREGRNIRAFENATGVTVLIDESPGAVLLSAFDPVRREVAREAMVRLIQDGRIHPTRI
ncbi:MAG TPA: Rnase Y domain-containing protein, partial [Verrucomicrobiae bacterium]|nr:Rnase Y domain-containing protein [Verrucomicrobiae bacterium]